MDASSTVTFLFTDIEGSTRLWEDHPEQMAAVLADHDRLLRDAIEGHGGRVFSTAGDAFAAVFASATAAVEAAVTAQLDTGGLVAGGQPVRVRMAVHSGEVEERDEGFFGPVLNRCGRLRDAAHGGQVLVSLAIEELLGDRVAEPVSLLDLGEHRLRDLSRPEQVFQVCHPELQAEFPPLRSLAGLSTNLPIQVTSFVGRVQESAELEKLVRGSRLVTVTGAGGCGKSRLAVQVAAEMLDEFADGVWLVELASLADPELLVSTVTTVLGIREQPGVPPIEALTGYLRHKQSLLVIDNCEHLIEPIAEMVAHLLSHTERVRMIATSREPLHIRGEAVFHLPTLPVPEPDDDWDTLLRIDSVRLFAERADAAHPGFRVTHTNAPAVATICTHLDGIPLAVELAAAATRLMSPDQISERLDDRFRLLTGGARDDVDHHRTLGAAIDWSHQLLTPEQQALFARLAVFAGTFTIEAAEQVCADETIPATDVWETIVQLADRSLLETEQPETGDRYGMLETIRTYASDRLGSLPDQVRCELNERHCEYFLAIAEEVGEGPMSTSVQPQWMAQMDAANPDFRWALARAIENEHDQHAVDLFGALGWYWHLRRRYEEASRWLAAVPLNSAAVETESRIRALIFAGRLLTPALEGQRTNVAGSVRLLEESLQLARQLGRPDLIAESLRHLGGLIAFSSDNREAVPVLEEAIEQAKLVGDLHMQTSAQQILALVHRDAGRMEAARNLLEKNLTVARRLGDDRTVGLTLGFLGAIATRQGDLEAACRLGEESLSVGRSLGDFGVIGNGLGFLGQVYYLRGNLETARDLAEERADLSRRTLGEEDPVARSGLGFITLAQDDPPEALRHLRSALSGHGELQERGPWDIQSARRTLWGLSLLLLQQGELRQSAVILAAVEASAKPPSPPGRPPWIAHEHAQYLQQKANIQAALDPDALNQAQKLGQSMELGEAIRYALNLLDTPAAE